MTNKTARTLNMIRQVEAMATPPKEPAGLSRALAEALETIRQLKKKLTMATTRPLAAKAQPRPQLPPSLREEYAKLTTPAERQAFLKKHWRALHDSNK